MELRNYQEQVITDLSVSLGKGNKRVILQAATGSGKTVMASSIVKRASLWQERSMKLGIQYRLHQ